ncbi:MAG: RICIN domain-containing protein [Acidobacteria bacterium]|nr:RICIN domain-containing protein [Acidobacteriota bacterium]
MVGFKSGRYEIQLVANRMLAVGANRTVVQTVRATTAIRDGYWRMPATDYMYIKSADTGEVMTVSSGGSGSTIVLPRQRRAMATSFGKSSGPDNDYYLISRRGQAMDSPSSARYDGGRMQVYNRNGETNQRFRLNPVAGGRDDNYDRRRQGNPPYDRRPGDYDQRPGYGGSGSMTWSGRVDGTVELIIQGNYVQREQYRRPGRLQFTLQIQLATPECQRQGQRQQTARSRPRRNHRTAFIEQPLLCHHQNPRRTGRRR